MKTITYIATQDSIPLAFEGPEKPVKSFEAAHYVSAEHEFMQVIEDWKEAMSTARESALPVVNVEPVGDSWYVTTEAGTELIHVLKTAENTPMPGWGLKSEPLWDEVRNRWSAQNVYRLVRSEPEKQILANSTYPQGIPEPKKSIRERIAEGECVSERGTDHCPVCIDSCDAAHHKRNIQELIEKPENKAHGDCPNITSCLCITYDDCTLKRPVVEPSESQEEMLDKIVIAYRNWLDDPETGMKAYRIFQKEQLEKFTITRK